MAAIPSFEDGPGYVPELTEFLRIPSVSADPLRRPEMREAAEWVARRLAFASGRVVETAGHPSVRDGRIYARGATDDKGPMLVPLKVAEAFLDQLGALPLNVRFLFEGEEEVGSPSLVGVLRDHHGELEADLVVSADGAMWRASEPSIAIAAKGLLALDVVVTGPRSDLHSGRHG